MTLDTLQAESQTSADGEVSHSISASVWWVWTISDMLFLGIAVSGALTIALVFQLNGFALQVTAVLTAILAAVIAVNIALQGKSVRSWRIVFRETEIQIDRGVLIRECLLIPINRIQHIDLHQGPLERLFGVQSLRIATSAEVTKIPGLVPESALAFQRRLIDQVKHTTNHV